MNTDFTEKVQNLIWILHLRQLTADFWTRITMFINSLFETFDNTSYLQYTHT